jgi:L,D-transpeptidase ErfK/SrfK
MKKIFITVTTVLFYFLLTLKAYAEQYIFDSATGNTVVGEIKIVSADERETLLDIARIHGFGYQDMKLINVDVDTWLPGDGQKILLPAKFILPVAPMKGIVLNVPEMRLYYYPQKKKGELQEVHTYPLGVGREGWNTPYIKTMIVEKKVKPNWHPPKSIRKEHEEAGDPLPKIVRPGPDNPLGTHAMRLGRRDYLIHGTNKPYGIGMRISHGCIRLYPEDIKELFSKVSLETPVNIINQPYKVGIKDDVIYLEAHPFLDEDKDMFENNLTSIISMVIKLSNEREYQLDMSIAYEAIKNPNGLPIPIGIILNNSEEEKNKSLAIKTE